LKNGDFSADANGDGIPDQWLFAPGTKSDTCKLETSSTSKDGKKPSTMFAQHGVPVKKGQWYRISLKARAEDLTAKRVAIAIQNTANWQSCFAYQYFSPAPEWKEYRFEVQSNATSANQTRFQIWYADAGKLWLSNLRFEPISDPTKGRWLEGLYLDIPEAWDDPYRFFRW
jgi:hypothetical protein